MDELRTIARGKLTIKPLSSCLLSALVLAVGSTSTAAATLPVTNCNDAGNGSLRETLASAQSGDTVDLRSLDTPTQTRLEKEVETAAKHAADVGGVGFHFDKKAMADFSKARPQADRLKDAVVQTAVATANFYRKPGSPAIVPQDVGSTDANIAISMGIPAVAVGAVAERLAHRLEENADASSIVPGIKSLIALAVSLAGK